MTWGWLVSLLADPISRREDAVIHRAGLSNYAGSLALRVWNQSDDLTHIQSERWLENESRK
jgi:hypothetical protein